MLIQSNFWIMSKGKRPKTDLVVCVTNLIVSQVPRL